MDDVRNAVAAFWSRGDVRIVCEYACGWCDGKGQITRQWNGRRAKCMMCDGSGREYYFGFAEGVK